MGVHRVLGRPRHRARRGARWWVVPGVVALLVTTAVVWQSAYAGFRSDAPPLTAGVTTGTVALTNSVSSYGTALTLGDVLPGQVATQCIVVRSTGSVPAEVRLYSSGKSTTRNLAAYISLNWVAGTGGGASGDCTGFVAGDGSAVSSIAAFPTTWSAGVLPWTTSGNTAGESRTYRLTYTVSASAPASTKGGTATVTFLWQAQTP